MKNEDLALAISYLDDDIIADAHTRSARRLSSVNKWMSIAASFALVICLSCAAFLFSGNSSGSLFGQNSFEVSVFGNDASDTTFVIPDMARSAVVELSGDGISNLAVPISITTDDQTTIFITGGTLQVYDGETFVLLYEGDFYEANSDVSVVWLLNSGESNSFEILVENKNTIIKISLEHESDSGNWFVEKEKIKK